MNLPRFLTAAVATTLAATAGLLIFAKRDASKAAAGLNAVSHIAWGDTAFFQDSLDLKHTALGAALNGGAMLSWAGIAELLPEPRSRLGVARNGVLISLIAYVTDYFLVPERLKPGFERRLSAASLLELYALIAGAYALSAAATRAD